MSGDTAKENTGLAVFVVAVPPAGAFQLMTLVFAALLGHW